MKTSTLLILAGAGVALYLAYQKSSASTSPASTNSLLSSLESEGENLLNQGGSALGLGSGNSSGLANPTGATQDGDLGGADDGSGLGDLGDLGDDSGD